MPTKRDVLEQLKRDELLAAVERYEIPVRDRRIRGELVEALAGARRAPLADTLEDLPRIRLKQICRDLGLDDSGREKAVIIERLTGRVSQRVEPPSTLRAAEPLRPRTAASPAIAAAPPRHPERSPGDSKDLGGGSGSRLRMTGKRRVDQTPPSTGKLTRETLERHLWSAADILRGSIDSSDYKNYILGLLFLKRLSDRFGEECEALRAAGLDPDDPDEHQFFVPPRARWAELRKVPTDIGTALMKASDALEEANSSLEGVLAGIDFNDERRLGDAKQRDTILSKLLLHFSEIDLRNANLSEPDMLGRAYEYLIERFADDAGKKGGEFYTPHQVVKLMVEILAPQEGMRICDPTCGSGGMLIQCAEYVARNGGDPRNLSLFGQEKNLGTWGICKMNMLLHGLPDAIIAKGDTIRDPKLIEDGALMLFDLVIANPPFSLDNWGREVAENDPFGRFYFGVPPKNKGDLAFVQHMIAILSNQGCMAVVMPHGVLFRGGREGEIRERIVEEDLLETVIGLPANLFYGTGIPAAILILNRKKAPGRGGMVFFVDASKECREGSNQNYLREGDVDKIITTSRCYAEIDHYSRSVTRQEIAANGFSLNIAQYVSQEEAVEATSLDAAVEQLREAELARESSARAMNEFLKEMGFG